MKSAVATATERMAERSTAAAETSLATLALGRISGLIRSTRASMAVLNSSRTRTKLMVKLRRSHSVTVKPMRAAMPEVIMPATRWIRKLGSCLRAILKPERAKPKL